MSSRQTALRDPSNRAPLPQPDADQVATIEVGRSADIPGEIRFTRVASGPLGSWWASARCCLGVKGSQVRILSARPTEACLTPRRSPPRISVGFRRFGGCRGSYVQGSFAAAISEALVCEAEPFSQMRPVRVRHRGPWADRLSRRLGPARAPTKSLREDLRALGPVAAPAERL